MIDGLYTQTLEQSGLVHAQATGKYERVQELPKEADSFDKMFEYADAFGKIRLAYLKSTNKVVSDLNAKEKYSTAIGGEFGLNTATYNGINFHIAGYVSQTIHSLNPSKEKINEDFTDLNKNAFFYIGEVSLDYYSDALELKVGRIKIETPYANSDDIRMASNTFEGAWANINYTSNLKTQLVYVDKWAGYDSQDEATNESQEKFKKLVNDKSFGLIGTSFTYEYAQDSQVSFWYNYIDEMASIVYAEVAGIYYINQEEFSLDYALQVSTINELAHSAIDGNVWGAMAILHYNKLFLGAAYNAAYSDKGDAISDGFGGGPYYTSLDEATIASISQEATLYPISNNVYAYRIGGGYDFQGLGIENLVFEGVYGKLHNREDSIIEKDAIITYEVTPKWYVEAIYTNYKSSQNQNSFDRALVRVDYNF